jgi:uncharacterized membrane protein YfcA
MFIGLIIGLIAGLLAGLFGIGGGIIIVPFLTSFLKFSQSKAVGTSLAALLLPVGLLAVWKYAKRGDVDFKVAGMIAIGIFVMALVGANFGLAIGDRWLARLFGILLVVVGVKFLIFAK